MLDRERGLAHDDRDDRRLAVERLEAGLRKSSAERNRVRMEPVDEGRLGAEHTHRGECAAGDRGRDRVREELRPRALREQVADLVRGRDEAAGGASEGLAERARDDVDLAEHAEVLCDAAARSRP